MSAPVFLRAIRIIYFAFVASVTVASPIAGAENDLKVQFEALEAKKKELSGMRPTELEGPEFEKFLKEYSKRAGEIADAFKAFYQSNKESKEGREAWDEWMDHLDLAAQGIPERKTELEETEKRFLADPNLSKAFREQIRWSQVDRIRDLGERERFARSVKDEFSGTSFISHHLLFIAQFTDTEHACALVEEVLKMPRSEHERTYWEGQALELRAKLDRVGKPLELTFTALDGDEIDLKNYSGKVVLIDFWATWCPPCVVGLPKVRALWEKHREEGFEVICISYDTDRKTLESFIRKNSLPWPQYFSEEGNNAPLVAKFGKPGPPAYWLVDRSGKLADISGWNDLEGKVKRLISK
jgi:peroxiredoxin